MRNAVLQVSTGCPPLLPCFPECRQFNSAKSICERTSGRMRIALLTGVIAAIAAAATDAPQQIHIACELKRDTISPSISPAMAKTSCNAPLSQSMAVTSTRTMA